MNYEILGSGSSGNCIYVESPSAKVLIDCGLSFKKIYSKLGSKTFQVDAVFITHEHDDHIRGLSQFVKKVGCELWCHEGVAQALPDLPPWVPLATFRPPEPCRVRGLIATPFPTLHDASAPVGFVLSEANHRLAVLTDTGLVTNLMRYYLSGVDTLILEFNYDYSLLSGCSYPDFVKMRICGALGHLSNKQAYDLCEWLSVDDIIPVHISKKTNSEEQVGKWLKKLSVQ